jgi:hypothetical protein
MKVRRRPRNDWGFQKQQFLSGQIESEAMKVNLDWWNTCNAFPPFFIFSLFCFQGPPFENENHSHLPIPTPGGHCPQAVDHSIFLYRLKLS